MTSALAASFMKIAWPSGLLRLSVIAFLLRCRFWKSKPWRELPVASAPSLAGASILMTGAPPALTSFESRLPLLHESAAAFLEVLAVEAGLGHDVELLVVLLRLRLGDLARGRLGERNGERRVLSNGVGDVADHRVELGIGRHAVHQAHLVGFL